MIDVGFLNQAISNKKLIDIVDRMVNNPVVYCIKPEFYKETGFTERVFLDESEISEPEKYLKIDVEDRLRNLPCRGRCSKKLLTHCRDVYDAALSLVNALDFSAMYYILDSKSYRNYWEKSSILEDLHDVILIGAYLHDIGKALIGVSGGGVDDHCFIGTNYLWYFKEDLIHAFRNSEYASIMYYKLENILHWHMGFVLNKATKEYMVELKPQNLKCFETYLVSLVDWQVNTGISRNRSREHRRVLALEQELIDALNRSSYVEYDEGDFTMIKAPVGELLLL